MLHATGNVSLFWEDDKSYSEIEFLGKSSLAYFIEKDDVKHKDVITFNPQRMPDVFTNLLGI